MTIQSNHNIITIFLRNKSFSATRLQYKISYNCITCLLTCYLVSVYNRQEFTISDIVSLSNMYSSKNVRHYINRLMNCSLITQAGLNKYKLTDLGLSVIRQVNDNYDLALYNFCQKYNITL